MRVYSLAYLTASALKPADMVSLAAELGYGYVGLRLLPNAAGAPQQHLIDDAAALRETQQRMLDTGVGVFDLEIIRIDSCFELQRYVPLLEIGAALGAHSLLIAADDPDPSRLADNFARICQLAGQYRLYANLEFMPWTAVKSARQAIAVVEAAGSPDWAGVLVDALHFARSATTPADIAAIPRRWLHYAQICDAPAEIPSTDDALIHTARQERLLPGEGGIDLQGMFAALPTDLPVSVEVPNYLRVPDLGEREWARQALTASRNVLGDDGLSQ